jgi:glutamate--cysteine ligase
MSAEMRQTDTVVVSIDDLLPGFHAYARAEEDWGLGVEFERLPLDPSSGRVRGYDAPFGVADALRGLECVGWKKEKIGGGDSRYVHPDELGTLTLEPGGQLELSGAVVADVHAAVHQMEEEQKLLEEGTRHTEIAWVGLGFHPISALNEIPWAMKPRYKIMRPYLGGRGKAAHRMMKQTATIQTNLDFSSEADMAEKMRVASWMTPLLVALFANSPLSRGRETGALSTRSLVWRDTDDDRCGFVHRAFQPDFTFRDYAEYLLDVPMFFIVRDGAYVRMTHLTFRQYMKQGYQGNRATLSDWDLHKSTVFPEVRLHGPLEVRATDAQSPWLAPSVIAVTCGILYDAAARANLLDLVASIPLADVDQLLVDAARLGPDARAGRHRLGDLLPELVDIAADGLRVRRRLDAQSRDESIHLEPIAELLKERGMVPAQALLARWHGDWNHDPARLVRAQRF